MRIHGEQLAGSADAEDGDQVQPVPPAGGGGEVGLHRRAEPARLEQRAGAVVRDDGPGAWPAAGAADEVNASADMQTCEAGA
jgi:hypothetical protein